MARRRGTRLFQAVVALGLAGSGWDCGGSSNVDTVASSNAPAADGSTSQNDAATTVGDKPDAAAMMHDAAIPPEDAAFDAVSTVDAPQTTDAATDVWRPIPIK